MSLDRPLSPLEFTALGIILKRGPCVAHVVVREFQGSQTFAYRSGAGSVYPLLKRLETAGLLVNQSRKLSLSDAGQEALRDWLRPPFDDASFSTNLDLLRSRTYFLRLLSPGEIDEFLDYSLRHLRQLLEDCGQTVLAYRSSGDIYSELAMMGAFRETEARIEWLMEVRQRLNLDRI